MANFFQPGDASATGTSTPSPAAQEMARFRAGILGKLLEGASRPRTSFADFAGRGKALPAQLPGGLSAGIGDLLAAMSEPGAFTSTRTQTGTPGTPSMFSDLAQLGALAGLLYQSGALGGLGNILAGVGGALGIGGVNPALGDNVPDADTSAAAQDASLADYFNSADPAAGGSYGVLQSDAGNDEFLSALLGLL